MPTELHLGPSADEQVSILLRERAHPTAVDYWDANWVSCTVSIHVRGFAARLDGALRTDELARFHEGLVTVSRDLEGTAVLDSMDELISLRVTCGARGQVSVEGEAKDIYADTRAVLTFELPDVDQTYLSQWIAQLQHAVKSFPVLGKP